jgi:phytoene synthase
MKSSSMEDTSLLSSELKAHNRDRFLQCLFVPEPARQQLITLYALEVELSHVHHAVREEMIGHIRYAWWQEAVEGLFDGKPARGHPVLEALKPIIDAGYIDRSLLVALIESYREHFPQLPPEGASKADETAKAMLDVTAAHAVTGWARAGRIIASHRARFARGAGGWLAAKLLWGSFKA